MTKPISKTILVGGTLALALVFVRVGPASRGVLAMSSLPPGERLAGGRREALVRPGPGAVRVALDQGDGPDSGDDGGDGGDDETSES